MTTTEILCICLLFLAIYPFTIYPFILWILSKLFSKKIFRNAQFEPSVSILIPLHNEEKNIVTLLNSILDSGYPTSKLQIIFGSDGSTDTTNEILQSIAKDNNVVECYYFQRRGKNYVLNQLIQKARNEIILFVDADIRFQKGTIHKMVSYFADNAVGGVLANVVVSPQKASEYSTEDHKAQILFTNIRKLESEIFATVNNFGPCYAVRKELVPLIPNDKVCDDFYILLKVLSNRRRMILAEDAIAFDIRERDEIRKEFHRKMRFSAGGLSAIVEVPQILLNPMLSFFIISHKLLRWLSPIFLLFAIIFILFTQYYALKLIILSITIAYILLIILGMIDLKVNKKLSKIFKLPLYLFFSISGTIAGIFRFLLGKQNASWTLDGLERK